VKVTKGREGGLSVFDGTVRRAGRALTATWHDRVAPTVRPAYQSLQTLNRTPRLAASVVIHIVAGAFALSNTKVPIHYCAWRENVFGSLFGNVRHRLQPL